MKVTVSLSLKPLQFKRLLDVVKRLSYGTKMEMEIYYEVHKANETAQMIALNERKKSA